MSSSSNLWRDFTHVDKDPLADEPCGCLVNPPPAAKLHVTWKPNNPARRFFNCAKSLVPNVRHCPYFRWADPELSRQYKLVIWKLKEMCNGDELYHVRQQLASVKEELLQSELLRSVDNEEAAKKIVELQDEVGRLKIQFVMGSFRGEVK